MKIFIKYMVCIRCKMVVKSELDKLGVHYKKVDLGEADIIGELTPQQHDNLKIALLKSGLELMDDKKALLIEKIKNVIIEMVHYADEPMKDNFSEYLTGKLHHEYTYLSSIFSEVTGITIEHYLIAHKIERVKELLLYDNLSLSEISYRLNYSSVAHLSNQFKKVTGLTPTYFKALKNMRLKLPENV